MKPFRRCPTPNQMQEFVFRLPAPDLQDLVDECWERGLEEARDVTRCVARKLFPALALDLPPAAKSPFLYPYQALELRVQTALRET